MTSDKSGWVIGKVLDAQVAARGDERFIQFENEPALTFREFDGHCNTVGNAFAAIGVGFDQRSILDQLGHGPSNCLLGLNSGEILVGLLFLFIVGGPLCRPRQFPRALLLLRGRLDQ